jgi:hypothetical protein
MRVLRLTGFAVVPLLAAALWLNPAIGQPTGRVALVAADSPERIAELSRDVEREEGLRAAKNLQYLYTQYAQYGLWDEMASLFADDADWMDGDTLAFAGREAIARYLKDDVGGGKNGLPVGGVHADFLTQPVVTMSYDGGTVTGRWSEFLLDGQYDPAANSQNSKARWSGGMQVNDYVKERGVWKIARVHVYPQFAGPYETGFISTQKNFPLVPYHYSPGEAGRPVPDQPGGIDKSAPVLTLDQIEKHVQALDDEQTVRNLQNIYGYYIDRKMWSDVTDLFTDTGALERVGQGIWTGPKNIRKALEQDGPEGLQRGQVNDYIQMNQIVTVDANGTEARGRGIELGMLTPKLGEAYWALSTFENRYVKGADGKWRIAEMRIYPQMKTDYYQGWGKNRIVDPALNGATRASSAANRPQTAPVIPAFLTANPVTGKPVAYPAGFAAVGGDRLVAAPAALPTPALGPTTLARITEARRKLNIAKGYDAVENLSNSFGFYLNDTKWDDMVAMMSDEGTRPQGTGFYKGREHVYKAMTQTFSSGPPSRTNPRYTLSLRQRLQPVIDVGQDGQRAKIRTRLLLYSAHPVTPSVFASGMYPDDMAVVEDGVWKLNVAGEVEESYFASTSYKDGWARPRPPGTPAPPPNPQAAKVPRAAAILGVVDFPPDMPWALFQDFRLKGTQATNWPDIKPMWFAYRNPVSGRMPPNYCAVFLECYGYR